MTTFIEHVEAHKPEGYDLCLDSYCTEHGTRRDCTCWNDNQDVMTTELGFSWSACDSCGSTLGGDRYTLSYVGPYNDKTGCDIIELASCVDRLMYCANGYVPDEQ